MRTAVIGHVEWVDFVRVEHMPAAGEIVNAIESWEEPAGGGAVIAVQLAKLAGDCTFFTALGDDDRGERVVAGLESLGVRVEAVFRPQVQRRAFTHIDSSGERTITVVGERLAPLATDELPYGSLDRMDAVFVTSCDAELVKIARGARVLVATARLTPVLARSGVELDALAGSARDAKERFDVADFAVRPRLAVRTDGARGGTYEIDGTTHGFDAAPLPGEVVDTYGAGDSFMGGLTFALARGDSPPDAIAFAARCGAAVVTGRGPYETQLRS